jgi:hypothetical protein
MKTILATLAICLAAVGTAVAGDCGKAGCATAACGHVCGACPKCGCKMECKTVCTVKEVKKTVWNVKCEPFCVPLPGCGRNCGCGDPGCSACGDGLCDGAACTGKGCRCDPCAVEKAKRQVPPKCGPVRCKKVLEKKEIVCKVPTYKCVPTCPSCGQCGSECGGTAAPPVKSDKEPAPVSAPGKTTLDAPMPPVMGVSFAK